MASSESPVAIVTGAGSGIGRATARRLLAEGWRVALVGRRAAKLEESASATETGTVMIEVCDITEAAAVRDMVARVREAFGPIDALVNSAGTNTPGRSLEVLSDEDYHRVLETNLHGAFNCVQAVLPEMRRRGAGTIVNVNSEAGRHASAKSGVAYVISKFGLAGLTQSINAEERARGIRASSVYPGDVDTGFLELRSEMPSPEARSRMLTAEDVAACVWLILSLPPRAIVEELVVRPH